MCPLLGWTFLLLSVSDLVMDLEEPFIWDNLPSLLEWGDLTGDDL